MDDREWLIAALHKCEQQARVAQDRAHEQRVRGHMAGLVRAAERFGVITHDEIAGINEALNAASTTADQRTPNFIVYERQDE